MRLIVLFQQLARITKALDPDNTGLINFIQFCPQQRQTVCATSRVMYPLEQRGTGFPVPNHSLQDASLCTIVAHWLGLTMLDM